MDAFDGELSYFCDGEPMVPPRVIVLPLRRSGVDDGDAAEDAASCEGALAAMTLNASLTVVGSGALAIALSVGGSALG